MTDFEDLIKDSENSEYYDILTTLISGDIDIDLKSDIKKPQLLTVLMSISNYAETTLELPRSAKTLKTFVKQYLRYMISYNRGSREEIIRALIGWVKHLDEDNNKNLSLKEILEKKK